MRKTGEGAVVNKQEPADSRKQLDAWMNARRRELRVKWNEVARRANMTPSNLLRIRRGQISISEDAADGIEDALLWERGSVEAAVTDGIRPAPRADDEDDTARDRPASSTRPATPAREWTEADLVRFRLLEQLFESWGEEMTSAKVKVVLAELQRRLTAGSPQGTGQAGGQSDADSDRPPVRGTSK